LLGKPFTDIEENLKWLSFELKPKKKQGLILLNPFLKNSLCLSFLSVTIF